LLREQDKGRDVKNCTWELTEEHVKVLQKLLPQHNKRKCEEFDPKHQPEAKQKIKRQKRMVEPMPDALESAWAEYKARESGSDELATAVAFDTWDELRRRREQLAVSSYSSPPTPVCDLQGKKSTLCLSTSRAPDAMPEQGHSTERNDREYSSMLLQSSSVHDSVATCVSTISSTISSSGEGSAKASLKVRPQHHKSPAALAKPTHVAVTEEESKAMTKNPSGKPGLSTSAAPSSTTARNLAAVPRSSEAEVTAKVATVQVRVKGADGPQRQDRRLTFEPLPLPGQQKGFCGNGKLEPLPLPGQHKASAAPEVFHSQIDVPSEIHCGSGPVSCKLLFDPKLQDRMSQLKSRLPEVSSNRVALAPSAAVPLFPVLATSSIFAHRCVGKLSSQLPSMFLFKGLSSINTRRLPV
jgi:hypothetical protein